MTTRRGFLSMLGTIGLTAPAIVSAQSLMLINPKAGILQPRYTLPNRRGEVYPVGVFDPNYYKDLLEEAVMDFSDEVRRREDKVFQYLVASKEIGIVEGFSFITSPLLEVK